MRYAPPRTPPPPNSQAQNALPWANGPVAVLDLIEDVTVKIQGRIDMVEGQPSELAELDEQAKSSVGWLMNKDAATWYLSLRLDQQGSFCTLLRHIASECGRISREDGSFITLNYVVSLVLSYPVHCSFTAESLGLHVPLAALEA